MNTKPTLHKDGSVTLSESDTWGQVHGYHIPAKVVREIIYAQQQYLLSKKPNGLNVIIEGVEFKDDRQWAKDFLNAYYEEYKGTPQAIDIINTIYSVLRTAESGSIGLAASTDACLHLMRSYKASVLKSMRSDIMLHALNIHATKSAEFTEGWERAKWEIAEFIRDRMAATLIGITYVDKRGRE